MATAKKNRTSKIAAVLSAPVQGIAPAVFEQVAAKIEAQAAAAPEVVEKPVSAPRGQGIGAMVKDLIAQGLKNDEILTKVKEQFPTANTNSACVSWYRSDMKKKAASVN